MKKLLLILSVLLVASMAYTTSITNPESGTVSGALTGITSITWPDGSVQVSSPSTIPPVLNLRKSFPIVFTSTSGASGVSIAESTVTYRMPRTIVLKAIRMGTVVSGSFCMGFSSGPSVASQVSVSTGSCLSSGTQYDSTTLNECGGQITITAGTWLNFYRVGTALTTKKVTVQIDFEDVY